MKKTSVYISTLFGIGYFPKAPGTAGTLFAAMVYFILPEKWIGSVYLILSILFLSLISVLFISKAEKKLGHDNGKIVIDEFFGYFVAMMFLPKSLLILTLAFILFRFFDIFKPEPVNVLQKLPKGWGVMADDIMAGIYTNICLQILLYIKYIK